jgi:hypothetical protein
MVQNCEITYDEINTDRSCTEAVSSSQKDDDCDDSNKCVTFTVGSNKKILTHRI